MPHKAEYLKAFGGLNGGETKQVFIARENKTNNEWCAHYYTLNLVFVTCYSLLVTENCIFESFAIHSLAALSNHFELIKFCQLKQSSIYLWRAIHLKSLNFLIAEIEVKSLCFKSIYLNITWKLLNTQPAKIVCTTNSVAGVWLKSVVKEQELRDAFVAFFASLHFVFFRLKWMKFNDQVGVESIRTM